MVDSRATLRAVLLCLLCLLPLRAQEFALVPADWEEQPYGAAAIRWEPGAVVLASTGGPPGGNATVQARRPLTSDFDLEVAYELLDWPHDPDALLALALGLMTTDTPGRPQSLLRVGREWDGAADELRAVLKDERGGHGRSALLAVEPKGRLRLERRGRHVAATIRDGERWHRLQYFTVPEGPLTCYLTARNLAPEALAWPAVRVRFSELHVATWRPKRKPPAGAGGGAEPGRDWVVYATGPGWLHVGPRAEFVAPQKLADEIGGGGSAQPLPKTLLAEGFTTRDEALRALCGSLTRVRIRYEPLATPRESVEALFDGHEYRLRLDRGNDPEAVLHKGEEYDFAAEKQVLAKHGLTPRVAFGRQWLVHATGHGTVDGGVKDDRWMMIPSEPLPDEQNAQVGWFVLPDGYGGTFTYSVDKWEGPYRDNYGLARAMTRLGVAEVDLWPPGQNYVRKLVAADVAEHPRDYGEDVTGVQPIVDPPELRDWVPYLVADKWLRLGTRKEFEAPVKAREVIWGGESDQLVTKTALYPERRFAAREQALRYLVTQLTPPIVAFHPTAQPRETVEAKVLGRDVILQLVRDPDTLVSGYGGYDLNGELALLAHHGLVARKTFGKQWLVHATGHGTYSGGVKDDFWMMVASEPKNGGVTIPDGMGGTFGYSVDQVEGPFTDSQALARALQMRKLKAINLVGEDRGVRADEAIAAVTPAPDVPPRIVSLTPDQGEPGQRFYLTVIAVGMQPWYRFQFGPGVAVSDETCLGKNPDGEGERWLATVALEAGARLQAP